MMYEVSSHELDFQHEGIARDWSICLSEFHIPWDFGSCERVITHNDNELELASNSYDWFSNLFI